MSASAAGITRPGANPFIPPTSPHKRELEYASHNLTSIEINATYYRTQSAASFAKWRDETPEGFIFSVKAPRFAVMRKTPQEAGESIERFFASGVMELGDKLGPILWQFLPDEEIRRGVLRRLSFPAAKEHRRTVADARH